MKTVLALLLLASTAVADGFMRFEKEFQDYTRPNGETPEERIRYGAEKVSIPKGTQLPFVRFVRGRQYREFLSLVVITYAVVRFDETFLVVPFEQAKTDTRPNFPKNVGLFGIVSQIEKKDEPEAKSAYDKFLDTRRQALMQKDISKIRRAVTEKGENR